MTPSLWYLVYFIVPFAVADVAVLVQDGYDARATNVMSALNELGVRARPINASKGLRNGTLDNYRWLVVCAAPALEVLYQADSLAASVLLRYMQWIC